MSSRYTCAKAMLQGTYLQGNIPRGGDGFFSNFLNIYFLVLCLGIRSPSQCVEGEAYVEMVVLARSRGLGRA